MFMKVSNITFLLTILLCFICSIKCLIITRSDTSSGRQNVPPNDRPIFGILMEEMSYSLRRVYGDKYNNYIAASYVKFIEGAGGRVVPIWTGKNTAYYRNILGKINGILWPGGSTFFNNTEGYAEAGYKIYQIAKQFNKAGDYFPILGTCLGFELLTYVAANKVEHRIQCSSQGKALPLNFKTAYARSRLFGNASLDIINILKTENVTINFHKYCTTEKSLKNVGLSNKFRVTSTNRDVNGVPFISSLEHITYPFYGVQFHPEKNLYVWITDGSRKNIPHTANAIRVGQYFANFLVNEGRKSTHRFRNHTEELYSLIYNYPAVYTGLRNGSAYEQCYLFTRDSR